jgi:hypothetical protein
MAAGRIHASAPGEFDALKLLTGAPPSQNYGDVARVLGAAKPRQMVVHRLEAFREERQRIAETSQGRASRRRSVTCLLRFYVVNSQLSAVSGQWIPPAAN